MTHQRDSLKTRVGLGSPVALTPEPQDEQKPTVIQLPFHLPYNELEEVQNDGFSKRLVKTVKAAILVALKKESTFEQASESIIDYLRSTRHSQNWLCSFNQTGKSEMQMKCHKSAEIVYKFIHEGLEFIVRVAELGTELSIDSN